MSGLSLPARENLGALRTDFEAPGVVAPMRAIFVVIRGRGR
jgi:hypothetical protein